jgi:hypothetical protein
VTIYLIDVHETVHTCPGEPVVSHPIDTRRTIVAITPGGPCQRPATIRINGAAVTVDCRWQRPAYEQCPACQHIVWTRTTTTTDLGYHHPDPQPAPPSGTADDPCPSCHTPVAATLRDGVHLLCPSPRRRS